MTLDDLHTTWDADSAIKTDDPGQAVRDIPTLHAKYWRLYSIERTNFFKRKAAHATLWNARMDWYLGRLDEVSRKERQWPVQPIRYVRAEAERYMDGDEVVAASSLAVSEREQRCKFLEDVIKSINNRGFWLKTYVDWLKFSQGAG